jgi:4-hydroxybenzoyl-CoA thioesterase
VSFTYATPVRFADVDHAGIIYFPRFFHLFHLAFEELWRARLGPRAYVDLLDRDRIGFPAVHAECDFRSPLRFGDTAEIELSVARLGRTSITFHYQVFRAPERGAAGDAGDADGAGRPLCADGRVVCAVTDLTRFVAVPVPDRVVALLEDLVEPPT